MLHRGGVGAWVCEEVFSWAEKDVRGDLIRGRQKSICPGF